MKSFFKFLKIIFKDFKKKLFNYTNINLIEIAELMQRMRDSWIIFIIQFMILFSHCLRFWQDDHEDENVAYTSR